ncbi:MULTISPECIES: hypothetical protein [unclassified Streptomyces]|uniref:hypothetical protein n=1 Tax=unclassified Streptomyces TaxID=2593676 RepID=UPI00136D6676|nr:MULTISPECIES: hypothetical protein [unclassified Streptomyces]NEA03708.1 hypothetical protein [Streptomyces sp. SID10116]MYY79686.1 hypothetical protein [Streptomyces sp. SID335]MYZ12840.1 hypothetical protein [Streptomyces sp. SID337]NDZ91144.1 hypothetical protein [Streptomyces sp. SID10115]NEB43541.1 hypothetical protein [Streptomyces sp. SID339]
MTVNPIERQQLAVRVDSAAMAEAYQHQPEPFEAEFAALACAHPEACTCAEDPDWASFIAQRVALNNLWRQAAAFNAANPVGSPVTAYPGARPEDVADATRIDTTTRSRATVLGGHTAVVWVNGHSACIALSHIDTRPGGAA